MARWRALRAVRSEERGAVGEERDLLAGSIWMGRRVNVSSIVGRGRLIALGADGDTNAVESESGEGMIEKLAGQNVFVKEMHWLRPNVQMPLMRQDAKTPRRTRARITVPCTSVATFLSLGVNQ